MRFLEVFYALGFIFSAGLLFPNVRNNRFWLIAAALIAIVSSYFAIEELWRRFFSGPPRSVESISSVPAPPSPTTPSPQPARSRIEILREQAAKGDAVAIAELGVAYGKGDGVEKDLALARRLFAQAVEKGNVSAMNNLAFFYEQGLGGNHDIKAALELFQRAANLGNASAMWNLANLYEEGKWLDRDANRSSHFLLLALRNGEEMARMRIFSGLPTWSHETRAAVQNRLRQAGFYNGPTTGQFDSATYRALESYAKGR